MIELDPLRTLTLARPSRPGRPAHVSAASGLVRAGEHLYVVADDENHLGIFPASGTQHGALVRIRAGKLPLEPKARKRRKPDFEALATLPPSTDHPHGALLALGSCSRRNRRRGVLLGLDDSGGLDRKRIEIDLSPLHAALDDHFGGLNIEGAAVLGEELVLLQRANKGKDRNARIRFLLDSAIVSMVGDLRLGIDSLVAIDDVDLGAVGGVPLGFSDGSALPDGRMVFTAIAEDTTDSYFDGACVGAAIGVLGTDGRIERLEMIEACHKVEGVEAALDGRVIRALLVTDADDAGVPASLLACEMR